MSFDPFEVDVGSRVVLRRLHARDLDAFLTYRGDPDVGRYQDWELMSPDRARGFLLEMSQLPLFQSGTWTQIGIAMSGELVGDLGIRMDADKPLAEIGVTLSKSAQGKSIGFAAVNGIIRLLFDQTEIDHVIAGADGRNKASIALMERLGMTKTFEGESEFRGEMCPEVYYEYRR